MLSNVGSGGDGHNPKRCRRCELCVDPCTSAHRARSSIDQLEPGTIAEPLNTSHRVFGILARSSGRCAPQMSYGRRSARNRCPLHRASKTNLTSRRQNIANRCSERSISPVTADVFASPRLPRGTAAADPFLLRSLSQNYSALFSPPGCGSSIASLTHRTAFGPSSPRLRARDVPERGPAPHDFACSPRERRVAVLLRDVVPAVRSARCSRRSTPWKSAMMRLASRARSRQVVRCSGSGQPSSCGRCAGGQADLPRLLVHRFRELPLGPGDRLGQHDAGVVARLRDHAAHQRLDRHRGADLHDTSPPPPMRQARSLTGNS